MKVKTQDMACAALVLMASCGKPEPIVTGAPAKTEMNVPAQASNIVDTSQPVTGSKRGDVIEGRHIPPALPGLSATNDVARSGEHGR